MNVCRKFLSVMLAGLLVVLSASYPAATYAAPHPVSSIPNGVTLVHYNFDGNVDDSSGNGNHGAIHGGVTFDDGHSGQAAVFDGSTGHIVMPEGLIREQERFSISLRFNTTESGTLMGYQNSVVSGGATQYIPILNIGVDGKLSANFWASNSRKHITTVDAVNDGQWHHLTLIVTDTSFSLELDGAFVGEVEAVVDSLSMSYNQLGAGDSSGYQFFNGWTFYEGMLDDMIVVAIPPQFPAPENVTAAPGNRQVSLSWDSVTGATYYKVYQSTVSNQFAATPSATVTNATYYTASGLTNKTTYYFVIEAANHVQAGVASLEVSATPVGRPAPDTDTVPQLGSEEEPEEEQYVNIWVNNKLERAGTASTSVVNNQTVTTVKVDAGMLENRLEAEGLGAEVTIVVDGNSAVKRGVLTGQMVKHMENKNAVIILKTDTATYTLPAHQIRIDGVHEQFGGAIDLDNIEIYVEIAELVEQAKGQVEALATEKEFTLAAAPVSFKVTAVYDGQTVEVSEFNSYVERSIALPNVNAGKFLTAVVIDSDGTVRHVPTKIVKIDGVAHASIKSLTNSVYAVIQHEPVYTDTIGHWAYTSMHELGARMIVSGAEDGLLKPNETVTRAEFAAAVVRGLGMKAPSGAAALFSDLGEQAGYTADIQAAYAYGLVSGFADGTFRPNDSITREQAMVIIAEAMKWTELSGATAGQALQPFSDADTVSPWARAAVADAVAAGIAGGRSEGTLDPQAHITRAEIAQMIQALLRKSDLI